MKLVLKIFLIGFVFASVGIAAYLQGYHTAKINTCINIYTRLYEKFGVPVVDKDSLKEHCEENEK